MPPPPYSPLVAFVETTVALLELLLVGVAAEGDAFSFEWPLLMFTSDLIFSIRGTPPPAAFFGGDLTDFLGTAVLRTGFNVFWDPGQLNRSRLNSAKFNIFH